MLYGSKIVASMGNYRAAMAWRKADRLAALADRNNKRAQYWEGRFLDLDRENLSLDKQIREKDRHIANLVGALKDANKIIESVVAERDLARAEVEKWTATATDLQRERSVQIFWAVFLSICALVSGALALVMSHCK